MMFQYNLFSLAYCRVQVHKTLILNRNLRERQYIQQQGSIGYNGWLREFDGFDHILIWQVVHFPQYGLHLAMIQQI